MKDEYSLLNSVEVDFSEYIIEDVNELEKKKMMKKFKGTKNKKWVWNKKKVSAVVVASFLAISVGMNGKLVLGEVNSFKHNIDTFLRLGNSKEKYSNQIEKTFENNNIKLTLNEFFTDNSRVIINLNINKSLNDLSDSCEDLVPDVYVNDKKTQRSSDELNYSMRRVVEENPNEANVILEVHMKELELKDKESVKLVFSTLAKKYNISEAAFTYSFVYDATNYKNACKEIKVDKAIVIGENKLSIDKVVVKPDRVIISGDSKGFFEWGGGDYSYDIVDENNKQLPLKDPIGKGAYIYKPGNEINTLKIVPYTFNKINTNTTWVDYNGRTKYIIEDKIITINLK